MFVQATSQTDLFGIPLPSNDPAFVTIIVIHVLLSMSAVATGLVAMFKNKSSAGHRRYGSLYFRGICLSFVTVIILAVMRWPHNNHLLVIGSMTVALTFAGRKFALRKKGEWITRHAICMGGSYILLLTGFYVDNGKHLPFWNQFPHWFLWVFPTLIGVPIIMWVLKRHPLTRSKNK
jgi:hypothetical protein